MSSKNQPKQITRQSTRISISEGEVRSNNGTRVVTTTSVAKPPKGK